MISGGFGHSSHPALMPAGVGVGTISHMDQESLPNTELSAYSQVIKQHSEFEGKN